MVRGIVLLGMVVPAMGHTTMNWPPTWQDPDGKFGRNHGYRFAGCTGQWAPGELCQRGDGAHSDDKTQGCTTQWYTNYTFITGEPTMPQDSPLRTYKEEDPGFNMKYHPWMAPGTAPVFSPCGVDGGNAHGCPVGNPSDCDCDGGGYGHGPDGRSLPGNTKPHEWTIGEQPEVSWGIMANHGGGYQYRLCPKPKTNTELTEECFQQMPLRLVGNTTWIESAMPGQSNRTAIPAMRTTDGTYPPGSQWTRNPIPACVTASHGGGGDRSPCLGPIFPPPLPGLFGWFGTSRGIDLPAWSGHFPNGTFWSDVIPDVSIVDKVELSADILPGDYVLSFRYDSEQTSQVWNTCADIRISAPKAMLHV